MADKATRGNKLKCQNEDCALPFYDLQVAQPNCPTCGTAYDHEAAKEQAASNSTYRRRRQAPEYALVAPAEAINEADDDDTDVDVEDDETEVSDQLLDIDEEDVDDHPVRGAAEKPDSN